MATLVLSEACVKKKFTQGGNLVAHCTMITLQEEILKGLSNKQPKIVAGSILVLKMGLR